MKKSIRLLIILAVFGLMVNPVFAADNPFGDSATEPNLSQIQFASEAQQAQIIDNLSQSITLTSAADESEEIVLNSLVYDISKEEVSAGKKFKVFENNFVFQIDKEKINSAATLEMKEIMLSPDSNMAPPKGFQLASKIYEYNFATSENENLEKVFWFSIKYSDEDYFRKNIYYYDDVKGEWVGIKGVISNGAKKIIVNVSMPKAKVAILENIDIMTEGYASWYRYKGCNCAASPDYPKGTKLKVTNLKNGKSIVVKINDWGPDRSVHPDRVIDLDIVAFKKIASKSQGLCKVKVETLTVEDAVK